MNSPIQQSEQDIDKYDAQLEVMNGIMVSSIRVGYYKEKLARGESLDTSAASWLYCMPKHWGTEQHLAELRREIVDVVELKSGAKIFKNKYLDAIHVSMHEILGECMYEIDEAEIYDKTGAVIGYEPILSQPCDIWGDK